jgi:hypothetical protein
MATPVISSRKEAEVAEAIDSYEVGERHAYKKGDAAHSRAKQSEVFSPQSTLPLDALRP